MLSWSGGKDSCLALAALRADPTIEVVALLTSITRGYERVSIHGVRRSLVEAQGKAVGLPVLELSLEPQSSNEAYETAFRAATEQLRAANPVIRRMAFGDLFLPDVRAYREQLLGAVGLAPIFPLWGRDTTRLAAEFIAAGFRAHLVCVDTHQLDRRHAGRVFDAALLAELPPTIDPCGERGEFHTFVSAGPIFRQPIPVAPGEVVLRDARFAFCDLLESPQAEDSVEPAAVLRDPHRVGPAALTTAASPPPIRSAPPPRSRSR